MRIIIVSIALALVVCACSESSQDGSLSAPRGEYIARIDGQTINEKDISARLTAIPAPARNMYAGEKGLRTIIDELIHTELLYLEARKEGLDRAPEYLAMVENYKKFALAAMQFERVIGSPQKVTEHEAKTYYREHRERFTLPAQIKASHILLKTEEDARDAYEAIRQGKPFSSVAKERSIEMGSAKSGGDLGYFSKGEMAPELEAVAFQLKINEVSRPVKSRLGYHLIKVTDIRKGEAISFDKVKDSIIRRIGEEKQQQAFNRYIKALKNSHTIETNEEKIKAFAGRYEALLSDDGDH